LGAAPVSSVLRDCALTRWLTDDVPAALMQDAPIPSRPRGARRSRIASLRGRRRGY
jgi:hypothetical protein